MCGEVTRYLPDSLKLFTTVLPVFWERTLMLCVLEYFYFGNNSTNETVFKYAPLPAFTELNETNNSFLPIRKYIFQQIEII
jgi:hypothetical protein